MTSAVDDEEVRLTSYALGSYSPAPEGRVLAMHQVGDYAGVWARTNSNSGRAMNWSLHVFGLERGGGDAPLART